MTTCSNCQIPFETGQNGTEPLCKACARLLKKDSSLRIRPIENGDLELILAWRSNPEIYRHFRQQDGPLDWDEHIAWFESRADDRHDFVIHYDGRRVGVLTIDQEDHVGIFIGDFSARGYGVATKTINWLCNRFKERSPLIAEIHRKNNASKQLFHQCGFKQADQDGEWLIYTFEP